MNYAEFWTQIRKLVQDKVDKNEEVVAAWLIPVFTKQYPAPRTWAGDARDVWAICFREHIKDLTRAAVREFKKKEEENNPRQGILLPGYKRVQRSYQIERNDEPTIVPVGQMTDQEVEQKAKELIANGRGSIAHGQELRRYLRDRRASARKAS